MEELTRAKKLYEELLERVDKDIAVAESFKYDMMERYIARMPLEQMVTIQSQVLRTQDYITQKHSNYVELQRQYEDILKAIDEAKAEAEAEAETH